MDFIEPGVAGRASGALLPARAVLARYGVVDRTLDRWIANQKLNFPRPIVINKRRYFREADLIAFEVRRASENARPHE
jgi:predicted DNA-binding transcriptional regulator AlpA